MTSEDDNIVESEDDYPTKISIEKNINGKKVITNYENLFEKLGKGGFGIVFKFQQDNGDIVAGKIINLNKYKKGENLRNGNLLVDEVKLQQSLNGNEFVKIIDYKEIPNYVYIFLEYCENGSLQKLLNKRKYLTEKEVQNYMLQIIIALNYLHSKNIIHRDLKLDNILLGKNMEIKIGDFGLATKLDKKKQSGLTGRHGTLMYCAPEILSGEEYSFEVEIWSLGVILCYLLTGKFPFNGKNEEELISNITSKNIYPSIPNKPKISKVAKDLIKQILIKDPKKRPSLNQIIYHDFFNREGVPKYLSNETYFNIPEDFPEEILNKDVTMINLTSIVRPLINTQKKYEDINNVNDIKRENIKDIDIYVKYYFNYNEKFGVGYLLNNDDIGVYYKDKTIILLNRNNYDFLYINKNGENFNFTKNEIPENLKNKIKILNGFIKTFERKKAKEKNINENSIKEIKKIKKYSYSNIYAKSVVIDKKCVILKLTNEVDHVFFADNVEIIMSKNEDILTYIESNRYKTNIKLNEALINPCRELHKRIKYIQYINIEYLSKKINNNYNDNNPQEKEKEKEREEVKEEIKEEEKEEEKEEVKEEIKEEVKKEVKEEEKDIIEDKEKKRKKINVKIQNIYNQETELNSQ